MTDNEQTRAQIQRAIHKIASKFPKGDDDTPMPLTDIHVRVIQDSGEIRAYDDDDVEITRCVVDEWIDNKDENFYDTVTVLLRQELEKMSSLVGSLNILKPYNFVLENDERETIAELFVADDETIILGGDLMEDLDKDLDAFFDNLMKDL